MKPYKLTDGGSETPPKANGLLVVLQRKELTDNVLTDINKQLSDAAKAAALTGKKAKLTIELCIEPKQGALNFVTKIKSTIPTSEERLCLFYVNEEGQLTREDPNQGEFELESHEGGLAENKAEPAQAVNG